MRCGIYEPFGYSRRNGPVEVADANPLPANAMSNDTGNAGADGYTVLARASRYTGERPPVGGHPVFQGPQITEVED